MTGGVGSDPGNYLVIAVSTLSGRSATETRVHLALALLGLTVLALSRNGMAADSGAPGNLESC